jgi:phosphohistidine phosphatase
MLLRHAEAGWSAGSDRERPLTANGRRAAARVGERLSESGMVPSRALVSSAMRTRQTWDEMSRGWTRDVAVAVEDDIYEAPSRRLLQVVREHGGDAGILLLVGHNPGVHDLLTTLAAGDQHARIPLGFPPATLAVVDLEIDDWTDAEPATGIVDRVIAIRA